MKRSPPSDPSTGPTGCSAPARHLPDRNGLAPKWVGDELRQVRAAAWEARLAGLRAGAEAAAQQRGDHQDAARKQELAGSYQALHDASQ